MVGGLSNAQIFSNFQCSISLLCLKIELRVSLLTYRNSYFTYQKNVFSMTLNFNFKVKFHFGGMGAFYQRWRIFANFQSAISPLSFMIELRLSLLTYRKSYLVYPKNNFSMTLTFSIKFK